MLMEGSELSAIGVVDARPARTVPPCARCRDQGSNGERMKNESVRGRIRDRW